MSRLTCSISLLLLCTALGGFWQVGPGGWYGWPDFHGIHSLDDQRFESPAFGKTPKPLLASLPGIPPPSAAVLPVHSSSNGFDFSRSEGFGHGGEAFIAQFEDEATATGKLLKELRKEGKPR